LEDENQSWCQVSTSSTLLRELLKKKDFQRKVVNQLMRLLLLFAALAAIAPLVSVFVYVIKQGWPALNLNFLLELPKPMGEVGGGIANALVGSFTLILLASLAGIPIGIGAGLFLSEYPSSKLAFTLRFSIDLLASTPSIIIGLFAYAMIVLPMGRFSALAGAFALSIIMIPTIARTTEELLKLVPVHLREAGLALGIPRWKVILRVVLRGSMGGILTGIMLSIARAAGETAPLLLTSLNNQFWSKGLDQPTASLPVQLYNYAVSPYDDSHRQAWAAALLLVLFVFTLNLSTRLAIKRPATAKD
jgi:phosphate transport system permease protein